MKEGKLDPSVKLGGREFIKDPEKRDEKK